MAEVKTNDRSRSADTKRLGALEAGVSALAIALTANGFKLEEGADPIEAAIVALKRSAEEANDGAIATLESDLHQLAGYASATLGRLVPDLDLAPLTDERPLAYLERLTAAANPTIENLLSRASTPGTDAAELEELRRKVKQFTDENAELETDLTEMTNARNALINQLVDAGKGTGGTINEEPPAAPEEPAIDLIGERPELARDVGPEFGRLTEVAIGRLLEEGRPFELVFSNGEFELLELQPQKISAADLIRVDSSRYIVKPTIHVRGSGTPAKIHGAGLLFDGEQVGYCTFEPSVIIHPGQERRFDRALIFG